MLWKFFNKKKNAIIKNDSPDLSGLFGFLIRQITVPRKAENILALVRQNRKKNTSELLSVYLSVEYYLCNIDPEQRYNRASLRQVVVQKFPLLQQDDYFSILFLPDEQKRIKTGAFLLIRCLDQIIQRFGRGKDGYLEKKIGEYKEVFHVPSSVPNIGSMQTAVEALYRKLCDLYGEALTGKTFEQAFHEAAKCFKDLETFTNLVSLLPNEIISEKELNVLSQTQIEQIYLEKLAEVEKLNMALQNQIAERGKAELLLRENEGMLSNIVTSALDAIITINTEGNIIRWNPAAVETFGYAKEEANGKKLIDLIVPSRFRQGYGYDFVNFLQVNESHILNKRLELNALRKDGIEIPVELTITAVTHDDKLFYNGFVRDISDLKRRERELLLMKEKAEHASSVKTEFLSVMSHEIRTPLNAVIGFSHLLLDENPRADQVEYLNVLKFSGENLLRLVNDILDFSKLDVGKTELETTELNLSLLIGNLQKSFAHVAGAKNIQLNVDYDDRLLSGFKGDPTRLAQVLNNLLSNAVKFTPSGSVTLKVALEEKRDNQTFIHFSVTDTGIGIPIHKQEKIFELFSQADNSTSRQYGGTGLGLNIAQKIIQLMGGQLEVQSEEGKGASFYFTIALENAVEMKTATDTKIDIGGSNALLLEKKRILLAEDHAANSMLAKQFITKWGGDVSVAENGSQVLEKLAKEHFDIILMDLQMPVMDGFECTTIIRKTNLIIPILALTASKGEEITKRIYDAGMNDVVGKPFKPKELKDKLVEYLMNDE